MGYPDVYPPSPSFSTYNTTLGGGGSLRMAVRVGPYWIITNSGDGIIQRIKPNSENPDEPEMTEITVDTACNNPPTDPATPVNCLLGPGWIFHGNDG